MKRALVSLLAVVACGRTPSIETPAQPVQPEPPVKQQQPLLGCEGKAVVALEGRTLTRISAAGSQPLFTFGEGLAEDEVYVGQWSVAGRFIAGVGYVAGGWEYLLMRTDGQVVFHERRSEPHSPRIFLSASGTLAVSAATGWRVRADGTVTDFGGWNPETAQLPSGEVLVSRNTYQPSRVLSVWKDGAVRPLTVSVPAYAGFTVVGSRAVFSEGSALVSVLDGKRIALPGSGFTLVQQAGDRFVLLSSETQAVLADLEQGTARSLSNAPRLQERYAGWNAGLQADGTVLAGVTRADQLQLQRSADLGVSWADLGEPMAMGEDFGLGRWLFAVERQGTVLALSMSTGYGHFVNEAQLISASGAHRLPTGALYVNVDLNPGAADLSGDGQCAATWVQPGTRDEPVDLVFMDVAGRKTTVKTSPRPGWLQFLP